MNSSPNGLIRLVAAFRLLKAAALIVGGIGILRMIHTDTATQLEPSVMSLGLDPGVRSDSDIKTLNKLSASQRDEYQRQLLQSVPANRFKLKAHLVSKESLAYKLVVAKTGLKNLKQPSPDENEGLDWVGAGYGQYHYVLLDALVMPSKMQENCPIIDQTGLTRRYDFELKWERNPESLPPPGTSRVASAPTSDVNRPSIFTAFQEQLSLKLVPIKAQLESIVIDQIEKPSPN